MPLGRRFRALKVWFVLRTYGQQGLQSYIEHHLRLAKLFQGLVEADERFEITAPPRFGLVCFALKVKHLMSQMEHMLLLLFVGLSCLLAGICAWSFVVECIVGCPKHGMVHTYAVLDVDSSSGPSRLRLGTAALCFRLLHKSMCYTF